MTQGQQSEALRLADEYEYVGFIGKHQFAREEWCRKAALELRRLHLMAEIDLIQTLGGGYQQPAGAKK